VGVPLTVAVVVGAELGCSETEVFTLPPPSIPGGITRNFLPASTY
jgi:hypothetical protein